MNGSTERDPVATASAGPPVRPRGRRLAFRVAAALFALVAVLGAAELLLRVQLYVKRAQRGSPATSPICAHERRGWCATPSREVDAPGWKDAAGATYSLRYTTDARGFRGGIRRLPNAKRLLVLGDSFTQALDCSDDKTYFARLQQPLEIEVSGYGCCGYGTLQELMALEDQVDEVKPDAVLLQLCWNDFIDNDLDLERQSSWNNHGQRRPYLGDDMQVFYDVPRPFAWVRTSLQPRLQLVDFVVSRLDRIGADRGSSVEAAIEAQGSTHPGFAHACRLTKELLGRFRARAGAARVFAFDVGGTEPFVSSLRRLAQEAGLELLEGVPEAVRAAEASGVVCRARDGQHWNEEGHRIAAEVLVERLRRAWLKRG